MQNIEDLENQLRDAIRSSEEYQEFKRLESIMMRNPDLKRQIDELRRQNFELQNTEDQIDMLDATENLNEQFKEVRSQEMVNQYLAAELSMCRLVQELCYTIVDSVDFDLDFLR